MKTNAVRATRVLLAATVMTLATPALVAAAAMPPERYVGGTGYVSGGIGEAEANLFKRDMAHHALAIEVLEHAGRAQEFTADAEVSITDRHGKPVLDTVTEGPYLLVDIPPGRYTVVARLKDKTLRKSPLYVARGQVARATFEFPPHTD